MLSQGIELLNFYFQLLASSPVLIAINLIFPYICTLLGYISRLKGIKCLLLTG